MGRHLVIDPAPEDVLPPPAPQELLPPDVTRILLPGGEHHEVQMIEGLTVREFIGRTIPGPLQESIKVFYRGAVVHDWDHFTMRSGDRLILAVVPQGGGGGGNKKGIIGAVLTIAVAVFAPYAAAAIYSAAGGTFVAANAGMYITAITAGITLVGAMAISALIKPSTINTGAATPTTSAAKSYSLTGQSNAARPYGACLVVYGRHKVMPALAANPDVDNWGQNTTLTALYDFGLGWVQLEDFRIGDVDMWQYSPEVVVHTNSLCNDLQMATRRIGYDQYAITLAQNDPVVVRTKVDTIYADMDLQFPRGIFQTDDRGNILPFFADLAAFWRRAGSSDAWQQAPVDWFWGANARSYTTGRTATIEFSLPGWSNFEDYWPWSSPARFRDLAGQWLASPMGQSSSDSTAMYLLSVPNPIISPFLYPDGPINDADYFGRYPEVRSAGWTGSATSHFESVGSREGRNPGVRVAIPAFGDYQPYPSYLPTSLHNYDRQMFGDDKYVGGWYWIDHGAVLPASPTFSDVPFDIRMKAGHAFDEALYRARYPDVDNAINRGQVASGWEHFKHNGAFEGRDPYAAVVDTAVHMTAQAVGPYWMRVAFTFPSAGEYELQVLRTDPSFDGQGGGTTQRVNEAVLGILRSYQAGQVVQLRQKHTMMEMRVRATDQLQGVVQNLSAIATSVLRQAWYDGTTGALTFGYYATRNPAWIVLDMLTSEKNPRPLPDAQIDWASWIYLAGRCDTVRSWVINGQPSSAPRYTCDIVIEDFSTVLELAESILSGCRASMTLTKAGTWGVLYDEAKTTPRQLITPGNSWSFGGARTFSQMPHALRVNFINRDNAWSRDEIVVYNDGYSAANATIFETLDTYGITDYAHAWAYGRFMLAQGIQRAELFTVSMDVENLLVQRGDLVHVAHDVPRVGGVPYRIVEVLDTHAVKVDRPLTFMPTGYAWRGADGSMRTGTAWTDPAWGVVDWVGIDNITNVAPDDLLVLGEYERTVQPYLVQRITPAADLTAELTLCKYVPGVYDADQGAIPPWDPGFGSDYLNGTDLVDYSATATSRLYYVEREPRTDVLLQWLLKGWGIHHHEIVLIMPSGQRIPIDPDVRALSYQWTVDAVRSLKYYGIPLQFEITPVSTVGFRGVSAYVTITIQPDRATPKAVAQFGANVQKENVDLFWQPPDEPDISHYLLRYTPNVETPNWDASQHLAMVAYPGTKTSAGARTGSYGIRAVDTSGNIGALEWRRTTVAVLPEINVIEVVNDLHTVPPWQGKKSHVVVDGAELSSEGDFGAVYPDGVYYMAEVVDLGEVFEFRVSSKIEAYGLTADDFMDKWPVLSQLPVMSRSGHLTDQWDCWLEIRTSNASQFMSDWVPDLRVVDPMAAGSESSWSAWRPCVVGDYTGQLVQMRIVLQSKSPDVKVMVKSGRVEVDMPDRIDSFGDIAVVAAGIDFVFPVAFRVLESVAVTIDGNASPVVAKVTNKQATGFHLQLINTQTAAGTAGQVDIQAEGYGRLRAESI